MCAGSVLFVCRRSFPAPRINGDDIFFLFLPNLSHHNRAAGAALRRRCRAGEVYRRGGVEAGEGVRATSNGGLLQARRQGQVRSPARLTPAASIAQPQMPPAPILSV